MESLVSPDPTASQEIQVYQALLEKEECLERRVNEAAPALALEDREDYLDLLGHQGSLRPVPLVPQAHPGPEDHQDNTVLLESQDHQDLQDTVTPLSAACLTTDKATQVLRSMLSRLPDPLHIPRLALTLELIRITTMDMIAAHLLTNSLKIDQSNQRTGLPLTPAERFYIILEPVMVASR